MGQIRQHPLVLGSTFIIIATLAILTLWDMYYIAYDYFKNNRVTLVTWENVNKTRFPFLENEMLEICLTYDRYNEDDTWFHELWSADGIGAKITDEWKLERQRNATGNIMRLDPHTAGSLSSEQRIDAMYVFEAIHDMHANVDSNWADLPRYNFLIGVLRDSAFVRDLQTSLWRSVRKLVISHNFDPEPRAMLSYLTLSDVCINLNLGDVVLPTTMSQKYEISVIPRAYFNVSSILSKRYGYVQLRFIYKRFDQFITPGKPQEVVMNVNSQGVFDRRETTPNCTQDPYLYSVQSPDQGEPCRGRKYVEQYVAICGCVPFPLYRDFERVDSSLRNMRFCTAAILQSCSAQLRPWLERTVAYSPEPVECAPSCRNVRNQYTLKSSPAPKLTCTSEYEVNSTNASDVCAELTLTIQCDTRSYTRYTEKHQLTLSQFLGQLGGDIGLYTGLSVLTIWQLLTALFGLHQKHRRNRANGDESSFRKLILREMGILEEMTMVQPFESSSVATPSNKQISDRLKRVEMSMGALEREFANIGSMLRRVCEKLDAEETNEHGVGGFNRIACRTVEQESATADT